MAGKFSFNGLKIKNKEQFNNIKKHNNREGKQKENINKDETHKNIILTKNNYSWDSYLQEKKTQIAAANKANKTKNRMIRENSSFCINYTFQSSKESLTEEEHINFLKEIDQQLREYFKGQEVLESIIHLDETTPHLHFSLSFFNVEKMKFTQKELTQKELTNYKNIEKALDPILQKYKINARETLQEKRARMSEKAQEELDELLKIKNYKDRKNAIKRLFIREGIKYGGEAYIQPKALKTLEKNNEKEILKLHHNNINKIFNNNTSFISFNKDKAQTDILKYVLKVVKYQVITKNLQEIKNNLNTLQEQFTRTKNENEKLEKENYQQQQEITKLQAYKEKFNEKELEIQNLKQCINDPEYVKALAKRHYEKEQERQKQQEREQQARQQQSSNSKNNYFMGR